MGIYVYIQLIHFVIQQKLTQHCKELYSSKDIKKVFFHPPMSLACRLFLAESNQAPEDLGKNSDLPLNCLKAIQKEALFPEQSYHQKYLQRIWAMCGEKTLKFLNQPSHCVSLSLHGSANICLPDFAFNVPVDCLPHLWSPKPLPSTSSFVFS